MEIDMTTPGADDILNLMQKLQSFRSRIPAQLLKNIKPGTALVLDPDDTARATLVDLLEQMGFRVFAVRTVEDARKTADALRDLSLVVSVPRPRGDDDRSGLEFLSTLKTRSPNIIPILSVSFAESEDAVGALRQNILGFFIKPYDRQEVLRNLSDLLYLYDRTNYLVRLLGEIDAMVSEWEAKFPVVE
ncbi:MAG: hypothetical protein CVU65_10705 [Deltaproteobacteria bacterium HGW-Deltaproteobacteria-22]|jgi:DNA-binding NtrC family response regulator|nr:MAG: hypothetical protein CVU65_10705 [Deltaproteobacteria bacterium HGW-Deltaproteobacteria-22]